MPMKGRVIATEPIISSAISSRILSILYPFKSQSKKDRRSKSHVLVTNKIPFGRIICDESKELIKLPAIITPFILIIQDHKVLVSHLFRELFFKLFERRKNTVSESNHSYFLQKLFLAISKQGWQRTALSPILAEERLKGRIEIQTQRELVISSPHSSQKICFFMRR